MTCPKCGQFAAPGDAFCARCGTPLEPPIAATSPPDEDLAALGQGPPPEDDLDLLSDPPSDGALAILGQDPPGDLPENPTGSYPVPVAPGTDAEWADAQQSWYGSPGGAGAAEPGRTGWAEPAPEHETDTAKWVVAAVVAVLAITAISLAGLALVHRSGSSADGGHSSPTPGGQSTGFSNGANGSSGSAGSSPANSSGRSTTGAKPVRTVSVSDTSSGTSYTVSVWAEDTTTNCAAHAYGKQLTDFLKKTTCTKMTRRLGTTTVGGKPVGFALTAIQFPSTKSATAFAKLVTKDGTGNLNDLLREGKALPSGPKSVPNPDAFSCRANGATVVVVDAWYLTGKTPTNDPPLTRLALDFGAAVGLGTVA